MTEKRRQKRIPSVGLALKGRTPYRLKIKKLKNYLKIIKLKIIKFILATLPSREWKLIEIL